MDRKTRRDWVVGILCLLGAGVAGYGSVTGVGSVGWLDALQQRGFGSYYPVLSFGLVMAAVAVAGGALWDGLAKLQGKEPDGVLHRILFGFRGSPANPQASSGPSTPDVPPGKPNDLPRDR
jgi:hypothetical protein